MVDSGNGGLFTSDCSSDLSLREPHGADPLAVPVGEPALAVGAPLAVSKAAAVVGLLLTVGDLLVAGEVLWLRSFIPTFRSLDRRCRGM